MTHDNELTGLRDALYAAALDRALDPMPIAAPFRKAVRALLRASKQIELVDGVVLADGQPLDDAVRSWCASDAAKPFLAPTGVGRAPAAPSGKRKAEMNPAEKGRYIREHGLEAYSSLPA